MEHTILSYLNRQSSQVLAGVLQNCCQRNNWHKYTQTIPYIMDILHCRGYPISQEIMQSWEHHLANSDCSGSQKTEETPFGKRLDCEFFYCNGQRWNA